MESNWAPFFFKKQNKLFSKKRLPLQQIKCDAEFVESFVSES